LHGGFAALKSDIVAFAARSQSAPGQQMEMALLDHGRQLAGLHAEASERTQQAMAALMEATKALSADQSARSADMIRAITDEFLKKLTGGYGDKVTALGKSMHALTVATKDAQEQAKAMSVSFQAATSTVAAVEAAHAASLQKLAETAAQSIQNAATATQQSTREMLEALGRDGDSTRGISQAAEQMAAAAKASRETVERFIALAERMRDLGRGVGPAPAAPPASMGLGPIELPPMTPQRAQSLSSAIRDLRRSTLESLPEL
jgi:hypothetical protein